MQVFRELFIRGEPEQLKATAEAICNSISGDWSRDLEAEGRSRQAATPYGLEHVYSFRCNKPGLRSAVNLFLKEQLKDKDTLSVTNIVPQKVGRLSYAEYNNIMEEFFRSFVQPAIAQTGAEAEMTAAEADLEDWMSPEAAQKLREFCLHSTKGTHWSFPDERQEMWRDFILLAHRDGTDLDSTTLRRWLHEVGLREVGEFSEEGADALASEYAFARKLLAQRDKQSVGV